MDTNEQPLKAKRTAKNSVFLDLFGDKKYLLQLYQTLHPINQYIIFCKVFDDQRKKHGLTQEAIEETIRICKDRNILRNYLESKEKGARCPVDICFAPTGMKWRRRDHYDEFI
jgi:hypothetical protein